MHQTFLLPVLYGEAETQVLVTQKICLPEPAIKILEVRAEIRDLTGQACTGKVLFQGVLHKQVIYVSPNDVVRHHATNAPFNGFVNVDCAAPGMEVRFFRAALEEGCTGEEMVSPTHMHEKDVVVIHLGVVLTEKICLDINPNKIWSSGR